MHLKNSKPILDTRRSNPNCFQSRYTTGQTRVDMDKASTSLLSMCSKRGHIPGCDSVGGATRISPDRATGKVPTRGATGSNGPHGKTRRPLYLTDRRLDCRHRVILEAARRNFPGRPPITALCPARIPPSAAAASKSPRCCRQVLI